jgi:tetratricopeptide (TPR) repeat protein
MQPRSIIADSPTTEKASPTARYKISIRRSELNAKYALAFNNRGNVHRSIGHYDRAIADYDRAIELNANYATAYFWPGARLSG